MLQKAKTTVSRLLKIRLRSEKEIRDKLINKCFANKDIERVILYFKDLVLIDDRQFTQKWIASRLAKPFGANRIRFELITKGIDKGIVDEELDHAAKSCDERDIVTALAKKQAAKYHNIDPTKVRQRVYGYLVRRGFGNEAVCKALKEL